MSLIVRTMFCLFCLLIAEQTIMAQICQMTNAPSPPFVPPNPYWQSTHHDEFWYGSTALWTRLGRNIWKMPHDEEAGLVTKLTWWSQGFDWRKEPLPPLFVTGKRLDRDAPVISASNAQSVFVTTTHPAMMVGMDIPTEGCWEITGHYRETSLSFVVRVIK